MKNNNTDSTANLSRFARDKRQRVSSTERVERTRPRREADNEGHREFRPRVAKTEKAPRASYNPHFTSDNRLRPEYGGVQLVRAVTTMASMVATTVLSVPSVVATTALSVVQKSLRGRL